MEENCFEIALRTTWLVDAASANADSCGCTSLGGKRGLAAALSHRSQRDCPKCRADCVSMAGFDISVQADPLEVEAVKGGYRGAQTRKLTDC
jgi:hypothetical protein